MHVWYGRVFLMSPVWLRKVKQQSGFWNTSMTTTTSTSTVFRGLACLRWNIRNSVPAFSLNSVTTEGVLSSRCYAWGNGFREVKCFAQGYMANKRYSKDLKSSCRTSKPKRSLFYHTAQSWGRGGTVMCGSEENKDSSQC